MSTADQERDALRNQASKGGRSPRILERELAKVHGIIYKGLYSQAKGRIYGAEIQDGTIVYRDFHDHLSMAGELGGTWNHNGQAVLLEGGAR